MLMFDSCPLDSALYSFSGALCTAAVTVGTVPPKAACAWLSQGQAGLQAVHWVPSAGVIDCLS